jgi:alpha-glucosidase (family GH31 glycosyl hydrolase)
VAKELQYPWRYGQQALDNYRFYTRLHTQLFPYINTYAKLAGSDG